MSQNFFSPDMEKAIEALKNGELIAFQTDTVPGLAVDAFNEKAVAALYDLKGRDKLKKLVWMSDEWSKVSPHLSYDKRSYALSKQLWPGPVTIVWKQRIALQHGDCTGSNKSKKDSDKPFEKQAEEQAEKQAVRLPKDDYLLNFFAHYPSPLAVTSANESGKKEAKSLEEVKNIFGDRIAFYLEHSAKSSGVPSVVVDVSNGRLKLLRQGEEATTQKVIAVAKKLGFSIDG